MGFFGSKVEGTDKFIEKLIRQAIKTHEAIEYLERTLESDDISKLDYLLKINHEIEEIRRVLIDDLHNTFITPIDREDIFNISNALFDMVDYAITTVEEMHVLKVRPDNYIRKMIELVKKQTEELLMAMQRLSKNPRVAGEHALNTKTLEKKVEKQYRHALRDLFIEPVSNENLPSIFYKREVYRHLSNMADRADHAANVFGIVVMKLT
ncbi:MAG: DUF47 domain-containing protein [Saprospiraceae bacterium]|jgi:uncharacterized protein Yka (UPF0111/DUF47 family)